MKKTLIIMRHAKAKRLADQQPDIERELSEAGKRSMKATLPSSLAFWPDGAARTELWASPAARTVQTAELLARALKRRGVKASGGVRQLECLWTGDKQALAEELAATEADVVAVVGHNPFAEDWTEELTGSRIVFATGAMACMSVDVEALAAPGLQDAAGGGAHPGRLLWFAQGPVSQRWKTLVNMERTVAEAAEAVRLRLDAFMADPEDIETMHKFRVSIRTLRSLVAFLKPWQDVAQNAKANADLRDIVGVTSRLRELDVLAEQAKAVEGQTDDLYEFCKGLAAEERAKVLKELSGKALRKKLDRACDELHGLKWKPSCVREGLGADEVRERFDGMAESLRSDLEDLDFAEVERTHDVRKRAKRVRYCAERFKEVLGEDAVDVAKAMTAHQDNLGAICDARVNIDIVNGIALNELPDPIAWDLALLRAENEKFLYTTLRDSR